MRGTRTSGSRGQAATEFIMTYGWAIMAVMVAIGALAYFGVLNPGKYLPERCMITSGFNCKDHKLNGTNDLTVQLRLENKEGQAIRIEWMNVSTKSGQASSVNCAAGTTAISGGGVAMGSDATKDFTCTIPGGSPGVGKNAKVNVALKYSNLQGAYNHTVSGEIQSVVQ